MRWRNYIVEWRLVQEDVDLNWERSHTSRVLWPRFCVATSLALSLTNPHLANQSDGHGSSSRLPSFVSRFGAVICDIDGCLSPETSAPIDSAVLVRIAEHNRLAQDRRDRPIVTLCSGRPEPFVEAMCRFIANHTLPCIAENGVWLYHPADNRYDMDPAITSSHLTAVEEARAWVRATLGPRGVVMQPGKAASISLYHEDAAFLRSIEGDVRTAFAKHGWPLRVSMTWFYINCDLSHISKATALDRFIAITGLSRERLAGIGDTPADAAIADRVAWFACPSNAHADIRPRAHYISPHAEAMGVLDILRHLMTP